MLLRVVLHPSDEDLSLGAPELGYYPSAPPGRFWVRPSAGRGAFGRTAFIPDVTCNASRDAPDDRSFYVMDLRRRTLGKERNVGDAGGAEDLPVAVNFAGWAHGFQVVIR